MMGELHHRFFNENHERGITTLTTALAIGIIGIGLSIGLLIPRLQNPQTSASRAEENPLVGYIPNSDIGIQINGPTKPGSWDYAINGTLCFNMNPPSVNGKYRVELRMPTKNNPAGEVIGASIRDIITNPATIKCTPEGRVRRDPAYTAVFNIPDQDQWTEACPEIQVHVTTEGNWNPIPQSRVGTLNRALLCPDGVPSGATAAPTAAPSQPAPTNPTQPTSAPAPTSAPRPTATPNGSQIDGRITVYSCVQPEAVIVTLCNQNDSNCFEVPYNHEILSEQSVWHEDASPTDRTHTYLYIATRDDNNELLKPGNTYTVRGVSARIVTNQGTKTYSSPARDKATVQAPATRDFTIDTQDETCQCTFRAKAYVKDTDTDNITSALDAPSTGALTNGIINDLQLASRGSKPTFGFTQGEADTGEVNFWESRGNKEVSFPYGPYGRDGLAHVRLVAPNYTVVGQECTSSGEVNGCPPNFKDGKYSGFSNGETGKDFRDLRVACGVNIAYGWVVKEKPEPEQPSPEVTPGQGQGSQASGALSEEALLSRREGFGANVTGGQGGQILTVTSLEDSKEEIKTGTLRWALEQTEPAIVKFAVNGTIALKDDINVRPNKTLDGRGADITITQNGLNIEDVENVIITNVKIMNGIQFGEKECNTPGTGDAIQIRNSKRIWVHHVTLTSFCDGLLDITNGSSDVTVSWSKFQHHSKTMLIGNSADRGETDKNITATISHNVFSDLVQRMPRVRFGKVDVYNNYYYNWHSYTIGSSLDSQVIVENNIFEPGSQTSRDELEIITNRVGDDPRGGFARATGNLLINGAREKSINPDNVFNRPYAANIETATESLKNKLLEEAGYLSPAYYQQQFGVNFNTYNTDLNGDGVTNTSDLAYCIDEYGKSDESGQNLACDLNKDKSVNAVDYSAVIDNFQFKQ